MTPRLHPIGAALLFATLLPAPAAGQVERGDPIPLSQHATVAQAIGWGRVDVEYRRPVARGRDLFGELVPWGEIWTPSADSAVVLTTTTELAVAGESVPPGSYALWLVPRETGTWTLILSARARVFHAPYPGPESDVLRVDLPARDGEYFESVLFAFAWAEGPRAELQFRWGSTLLPIPLEVR